MISRILQGVSIAFFTMALQISIIDALREKNKSQGILPKWKRVMSSLQEIHPGKMLRCFSLLAS